MGSSPKIVGIVEGVTGRTYDTRYDLFFTENSVVGAVVLHPSDLAGVYETRRIEELLIGSILRRQELRASSRKIEEERRQSYGNKTVQEVLRTHSSNFEIQYDRIVSAGIHHTILGSVLEFVTTKEDETRYTMRFRLQKKHLRRLEELLSLVLSSKKPPT